MGCNASRMSKGESTARRKSLLSLSLPDDAGEIAELDDPDDSLFEGASKAEIEQLVEHFRRLWHQLVDEGIFPQVQDQAGMDLWQQRKGPFWKTGRVIGAIHGYALAHYSLDADPMEVFSLLRDPEFEPRQQPDDATVPELMDEVQRGAFETALWVHLSSWVGLVLALRLDEFGFLPGELPDDHDADLVSLEALGFLEGKEAKEEGELLRLYLALFNSARWARTEAVRKRARMRRQASEARRVPMSSRELPLLASRSPLMKKKYGEKKVEKVFEQQLALVFQSCGFTVIPARMGEVGADLLCISREAKFSFLVDAKSSAKPYTLPKSDRRALTDYAKEFGTWLADLPDLEFILVVGPDAGKTLEQRLKEMEVDVQKPVRFASARLIRTMRDELPGPVIPEVFKKSILNSSNLLPEDLFAALKDASENIAETYGIFVERLKQVSGP